VKPKARLRIIVLLHEDLMPPETLDGVEDKETQSWRTEYDVITTLRKLGHEVYPCGLRNDLSVIGKALAEHRPHLAFNLLEEFDGQALYDQHVVSYLELVKQCYSGCNPRGLMVAHDKALTKKILSYHRIPVPRFAVFPMNKKIVRPHQLNFPLFVKSITEEASLGISRESVVHDDEKLVERVKFIHEQTHSHAMAEQYIEGREIYVSVMGNRKLQTFPPWELIMTNLPDGAPNIATSRVKWNKNYQKKVGLVTKAADLSPELKETIEHLSKRIYRQLNLSGYARLDYRMTESGRFYLLEANPNPQIAINEDFADSVAYAGIKYDCLLQKIITLGMSYDPTVYLVH
jgi:D-alanine-D-alanine ligase